MLSVFRSLKQVLTGEVVQKSDLQILDGNCNVSLRLKRNNEGAYVVLAHIAAGNAQYVPFTAEEFQKFAAAVSEIKDALAAETSSSAK